MERIHPEHPYIGAEVAYSVRQEMAAHVADVLLRRLPLGLLDMAHAQEAAPVVAAIMARELGWSDARREKEIESARRLLVAWFSGRAAA
jgi:glycerol-3-phosphate dehydrogenase